MRRIAEELVDEIARRHFGFEQSTDRWTQPARLCPAVACFSLRLLLRADSTAGLQMCLLSWIALQHQQRRCLPARNAPSRPERFPFKFHAPCLSGWLRIKVAARS